MLLFLLRSQFNNLPMSKKMFSPLKPTSGKFISGKRVWEDPMQNDAWSLSGYLIKVVLFRSCMLHFLPSHIVNCINKSWIQLSTLRTSLTLRDLFNICITKEEDTITLNLHSRSFVESELGIAMKRIFHKHHA